MRQPSYIDLPGRVADVELVQQLTRRAKLGQGDPRISARFGRYPLPAGVSKISGAEQISEHSCGELCHMWRDGKRWNGKNNNI